MYDINQPIFTYAGALVPVKKKNRAGIIVAVCAGLLLAALAI